MPTRTSRRRLLLAAGAGFAVSALPRPARADASEQIQCCVIGVGSRGMAHLSMALGASRVDVAAVCDIDATRVAAAQAAVSKAGRPRPVGFGERGPDDYRRMLEGKDIDAVIIATPVPDHARMAIDALNAGKAVLSEVSAAVTLEECWDLVRTVKRTNRFYMLAENVCYYRDCMAILNMVRGGLFGPATYADCGYVHDCRSLDFNRDGSLTWRGRMAHEHNGNVYPTHAIGPVAQWLDINRSDRFVSLVSMSTRQAAITRHAARAFGADSPQARATYAKGDMNSTLIRTAKGAVIDLRYDTSSARPHRSTVYHGLQGETGAYSSMTGEIWLDGRSSKYEWEPFTKYAQEFDHEYWRTWGKEAAATGHGGADFFVFKAFLDALRSSSPSPIDVYDAVTWSCITPLSAESIRRGSSAVEVPDFKATA